MNDIADQTSLATLKYFFNPWDYYRMKYHYLSCSRRGAC